MIPKGLLSLKVLTRVGSLEHTPGRSLEHTLARSDAPKSVVVYPGGRAFFILRPGEPHARRGPLDSYTGGEVWTARTAGDYTNTEESPAECFVAKPPFPVISPMALLSFRSIWTIEGMQWVELICP